MNLRQYVKYLGERFPADSQEPTVIVQQLACLAARNLANKGRLPASCGKPTDVDMDIVQSGILAGLEHLRKYDGEIGTLRAFLYKTIAGTMQNYAWKRENRITDGIWDLTQTAIVHTEVQPQIEVDSARKQEYLIEEATPETIAIEAEASTPRERLDVALEGISSEDKGMLIKSAQIGANLALRSLWAAELGISYLHLANKLSRARKRARDWALAIH